MISHNCRPSDSPVLGRIERLHLLNTTSVLTESVSGVARVCELFYDTYFHDLVIVFVVVITAGKLSRERPLDDFQERGVNVH